MCPEKSDFKKRERMACSRLKKKKLAYFSGGGFYCGAGCIGTSTVLRFFLRQKPSFRLKKVLVCRYYMI